MHSTFQLSPDDLNCLLYKANCYVKTQRFSDAIGEADRILFAYVHATKAQKSKAYAIKGASHYHTGYFNYRSSDRSMGRRDRRHLIKNNKFQQLVVGK